jgi:hypothetical protein
MTYFRIITNARKTGCWSVLDTLAQWIEVSAHIGGSEIKVMETLQ